METAISVYGQKEDISTLAFRIRRFMSGTQNLDDNEALAVAQIALAHDLDPFNGEVWGIKGKDGEWKGVMVGIKGLRKCAFREAKKEAGYYYTDFKCLSNGVGENKPEFPARDKYPNEKVVAYECHLRDDFSFKNWMSHWLAMKAAGASKEEMDQALGRPPVWIGIGVAYTSEYSKMEINQRAKKRAEADAIKQRYPVEFRGAMVVGEAPPDVSDDEIIEGKARDFTPGQLPPPTEVTKGMVDEDLPRPWSPEQVVDQLTNAATVYMQNKKTDASDAQRRLVVMLIEKALANPNLEKVDRVAQENDRRSLTTFATGYASTKDMPGVTIQALLWWLHPDKNDTGQYLVPDYVIQECHAIMKQVAVKDGQLAIPF
jgi:hypothetical protein